MGQFNFLTLITLKFLNKTNALSNSQHGFGSAKYTSTALYEFYNNLINYTDDRECPICIFCEFIYGIPPIL